MRPSASSQRRSRTGRELTLLIFFRQLVAQMRTKTASRRRRSKSTAAASDTRPPISGTLSRCSLAFLAVPNLPFLVLQLSLLSPKPPDRIAVCRVGRRTVPVHRRLVQPGAHPGAAVAKLVIPLPASKRQRIPHTLSVHPVGQHEVGLESFLSHS